MFKKLLLIPAVIFMTIGWYTLSDLVARFVIPSLPFDDFIFPFYLIFTFVLWYLLFRNLKSKFH